MKATARQQQAASVRKGDARTHGVQAKHRPGAGNRLRANAYERQAEEFASRVVRGERDLGPRISFASPARYQPGGSIGLPLPHPIRLRMEEALGADLGEVRIHSGSIADGAARECEAEAFTSGRNIYFQKGHWSPQTASGLELLAHELTHVLQQTGRRDETGRLRATNVAGSADVQRAPDDRFVDATADYELFDASPDWTNLKAAYTGVTDAATHIKIIEAYFPATFPMSPDEVKALAEETKKATFGTLSDSIQALYVDTLKWLAGYEHAWAIVAKKRSLPTAFRSRGFYEYLRKRSLGWIDDVLQANELAKTWWPGRFAAAYRSFLINPSAQVADLEAKKEGEHSVTDKILLELGRIKAQAGAGRVNELQTAALFAFYYLEDDRKGYLAREIQSQREKGHSLLAAYANIADKYVNDTAEALSPSAMREPTALFAAVLPSIRPHATEAAKFWNQALDFHQAVMSGRGLEPFTAAETAAIARTIKTDPRFKNLQKLLRDTAQQIFARPRGNLLSAGTFATRVVQRRDALRAEMSRYGTRIFELVKTPTQDQMEERRIGAAVGLLSEVEAVLAKYDAGKDKAKRPDQRVATRIRLARKLVRIGVLFGWDDLREAGDAVFNEGRSLAILSAWEPDPDVEFGKLGKELSHELAAFTGTKVSGALLDRFAYIQYFQVLTGELQQSLAERGGDFMPAQVPILTGAIREANTKARRPRRFFVRDWEVADPSMTTEAIAAAKAAAEAAAEAAKKGTKTDPKPPDKGKGEESFSDTIYKHETVKDLLKKERKADELVLAPAMVYVNGSLFIWFVPRIDEFVRAIAVDETGNDTVVAKAVRAHWEITNPGKAVPDPKTYPLGWVDALSLFAEDVKNSKDPNKAKLLADVGKAISAAVEAKFGVAQEAAHEQGRLAVSHQRRVFVENDLRPMLLKFDRTDLSMWSLPDDVFGIIRNFAHFVFPKTDQPLQVSAMVLEIADELMTAFGPKSGTIGTSHIRRIPVIDVVLRLAYEALRVWDEGQKQTSVTAPVHPITAISWLSHSALAARAATLEQLRDSLGARAEKEKKRHGLRGKKDAHQLTSVFWDDEGSLHSKSKVFLAPGQAFDLYGFKYLLVDIHESFTFHPEFGDGSTLGVEWPSSSGRPGAASLLDEAGNVWEPSGKKLITVIRAPSGGGDGKTFEITDKDIGKLTWFSDLLSEHFAFEYIAATGVFIEKYVSLLLDVLEFLPGIGQGVAAARFAANVLQTLTDPDFKDLLDAFSKDGFAAVGQVFDAMKEVVSVEQMASGLLLDYDFKANAAHPKMQGKKDRQGAVAGRGGSWQRIGVLLKNLIEIGVRVLGRVKHLAKRVQTPVRAAQLWVLRTPAAGLVIDLVERGLDVLSTLSIDDLSQLAEDVLEKGWQEVIRGEVEKAGQGVLDQGRDIMDTLRELEMPEEVIPVEWIIDFVVDLAVMAISAKYRKGVQAVRSVLRTIGLWDKVLGVIKDGLFEAGVDPNEFYRDHVRKKLSPWLGEVRDGFTRELTDELVKVPFLKQVTQPAGTPITLKLNGLGFPEAEKHASSRPARPTGPLPRPSGGMRLPHRERFRAEAALGHDFSHVRLHRGGEADRVTAAFGADALTTGSHVYLASDVNPRADAGSRVLHHELAHVLQQTGARPLGSHASDTPSTGRPNRGLLHDHGREGAADRAAESAASGRIATAPVPVGGRATGIQPKLTKKFLREFLRRLHTTTDIEEMEQELAKAKGPVTLDPQSKAVADKLSAALKPWLAIPGTYRDPFGTVHTNLKAFAEAVWPQFEKVIKVLVANAEDSKPVLKGKGEEGATMIYLPPSLLKVQLERALYALTSLAFVIDLNPAKGPEAIGEPTVVDKEKPVTNVIIAYAHLPLLPDTPAANKLWDLLVENTFKGTPDYNATTHPSFKAATKLILGRSTPSPNTYQNAHFKLTADRQRVIRNQRDRLMTYLPSAKKNPPWPDVKTYTRTDEGTFATGLENIGLRLGTYAVWDPKATPEGDRDPHHTVQFLLLEYFRNVKKGRLPFPHLDAHKYPGVEPAGSEVKAITGSKGKIDIENYFHDRGGNMPTVFIARTTHQANIHYRSEAPDDFSTKRSSQGSAVHNTFTSRLEDLGFADVLKNKKDLAELEKNEKKKDVDLPVGTNVPTATVKSVSDAIFQAAQFTYQDMWGEMKPKLRKAMGVQEVAYYNTIGKLRGNNKRITTTDMDKPFKEVADKTEEVIGKTAGFGSL